MSSEQPGARHLCRCEELTEADVQRAIDAGAVTINDIKRRTRFGMGLCQGAYCLCLLEELVMAQRGEGALQVPPMTPRPPARMIAAGDLAKMEP